MSRPPNDELRPRAVVGIGRVEQAEDVHQRALARPRRAHDGHHLARLDRDVDAAQGSDDVAFAQPVGLAEVVSFEERHRSFS